MSATIWFSKSVGALVLVTNSCSLQLFLSQVKCPSLRCLARGERTGSHMQALLHVGIGLAVGFVSGLFGITGGVITVPMLGLLGLGQQLAQGTSLVMQLPTGIVALWHYMRRSALNLRLLACLAVASGLATYLGARIAIHLPEHLLRRGFAIFLIALATFSIWNAYQKRSVRVALPWPFATLVGALGGLCSGLFGVGGATFTIPTLTLLFGVSQTEAQGLGLAVILPAILIGLPVYARAGLADWPTGLALGLGAICSVGIGVATAHRLPERALRIALCAILYIAAFALWLHG